MIRETKIEDYEQVRRLVNQVHRLHVVNRSDIFEDVEAMPYVVFHEIISNPIHLSYVYEMNQQIIGLIMAHSTSGTTNPILKTRCVYYIDDLVVDQNHQGKGIGQALYRYIESLATSHHADSIELNVWAFNENAIRFYESLGLSMKLMRMEKELE